MTGPATVQEVRWVLAPTPCNWCPADRLKLGPHHWHSVVGWTTDLQPRLGCILRFSSPTEAGEPYAVLASVEETGSSALRVRWSGE